MKQIRSWNRSINQGTIAEVGNGLGRAAINIIPSIIGNVASIVGFRRLL